MPKQIDLKNGYPLPGIIETQPLGDGTNAVMCSKSSVDIHSFDIEPDSHCLLLDENSFIGFSYIQGPTQRYSMGIVIYILQTGQPTPGLIYEGNYLQIKEKLFVNARA